jgi:hypothetical protein
MQPVVAAASIPAAQALLGISSLYYTPVGAELDWPGLTAPTNWKLENGAAISRTTYSVLLGVIAPVVACTITSGSSTITGISSTTGWGTGWIIESPGSTALASGQTIATVGGSSVTITGGNASANASSCEIFPYGTPQDGTFDVPNAPGVTYAGLDTSSVNIDTATCGGSGNPAYLNSSCGSKNTILLQANLPNISPTFTGSSGAVSVISNTADIVRTTGGLTITPGSGGGILGNVSNAITSTGTFTPHGTISALGSGTAFSRLPPIQIRNKIIFAGAP